MGKTRWELEQHSSADDGVGLIAVDGRSGARFHVDHYSDHGFGDWVTAGIWVKEDEDITAKEAAGFTGKVVLNLGRSATVWISPDQAWQLARSIDNTIGGWR